MVTVPRAERHRCFRNQRLALGVWTKQKCRLENRTSSGSLVSGVDARSDLRHRTRQGEIVCDLFGSTNGKDSLAKGSAARTSRTFAEGEWPRVSESGY